MAAVNFSDLEDAYLFVNGGTMFDNHAYVCRDTGRIYWTSDDELEEVSDDLGTSDRYVEVPDQRDLDLGEVLVMEFMDQHMRDDYNLVAGFFRRRGAYGRFKDFLDSKDRLEAWYAFENEAVRRALREWREENGLEVVEKSTGDQGGS